MIGPKLKILFSGMVAGDPHQGGATWAVLQYVLGLKELGHDVLLVEPVAESALRPVGSSLAESTSGAYFRQVMADFGLTRQAALLLSGTEQTVGVDYDSILTYARKADLLVNVSGMLADPRLIADIPTRAYLDLDPAFIQIWHDVQQIDMRLDAHNHFVTVGLALGSAECRAPVCGRQWMKTLQPIVLSRWPVSDPPSNGALTTVSNWRGYGSVEYQGEFYGQKAHSFREFMALPQLCNESFTLALAIHPEEVVDLTALRQAGWGLVDPQQTTATPPLYRHFITGSKGELGIAKSGYVKSRCGWFSDRSACYLASGRPVIAQDTGFSTFLPTGEGLLAFTTLDDAVQAIERLNVNYASHARAARAIAEEYFDSKKVLLRLLQKLELAA